MTIDQLLQYIKSGPQLVPESTPSLIDDNSARTVTPSEEESEYKFNDDFEVQNTGKKADEGDLSDLEMHPEYSWFAMKNQIEPYLENSESEEEENTFDLNKSPKSEKEVLNAVLYYLSNKKYENIDKQDQDGYSLLFWAVRKGYLYVAEELLCSGGASPDIASYLGDPAIVWAASTNNLKMVHLLLQYAADADAKDAHGESALTWATRLGNEKMTSYLIEYGAIIEDWSTWEAQMEQYPYCLEPHINYTPHLARPLLEEVLNPQKNKFSYHLDSFPVEILLQRCPSFAILVKTSSQPSEIAEQNAPLKLMSEHAYKSDTRRPSK